VTQVGTIKGTITSMSPEQACGKVLDRRSDIFSTGLLFYEMVTGQKAYSGDSMESYIRVCQGEFTPPEIIAPGLPAEVYEILHKALSRDPEARFQSCAEMLERLEGCLTLFSERQNSENLSRHIRYLFSKDQSLDAKEKLKMEVIPTSMREESDVDLEKTIYKPNTEELEENRPNSSMPKKTGSLNIWRVTAGVCLLVLVVGVLLYLHPFNIFKANNPEKAQSSIQIEASEKAVDRSDNSDKAKTSIQNEVPEKAADRSDDLDKAMKLIQNGDSRMAIELFEKLSLSKPELSQKISEPYAAALLHEAVIAEKTDPEKCKHLLLRSLEIKPDNPKVYYELGKTYTTLRDFPAAIESYLATTRLDPSLPEAFFNLGFLYTRAEDYLKAEEMYLKTIHLSPPYLDEAYFNLAVVLQIQGKLEKSIQAMETAVAINPQNAKAIEYLKKIKK
jgi:tetratricopeptide (TPR) repeat protein